MRKWSVGCEMYVLVSMSGFAVHVKLEISVLPKDSNIQHGNRTIEFLFHRPSDARVPRVKEVEKRLNMVVVNCCDGVVSFSEPKEDDIRRQE